MKLLVGDTLVAVPVPTEHYRKYGKIKLKTQVNIDGEIHWEVETANGGSATLPEQFIIQRYL